MDWLIYVCIALVAMKFGWWLHEAFIIHVIHEHPERLELAVKIAKRAKELDPDTVPTTQTDVVYLNIEAEPNGQLYAYNMSQFVAQGATIEEIHARAKLRYPNKAISATLLEPVSPN